MSELYTKATPRPWRKDAMGGASTILTTVKPPRNDTRIPTYGYREDGEHCIAYPFLNEDGSCRLDFVCFSHNDAELVVYAVNNIEAREAELTTLRAENEIMRGRAEHWEKVARSTNVNLGVALEAVIGVVAATRQYLPPDGISQHECINLVLAATDNPRINPLIEREEARNALAQVAK